MKILMVLENEFPPDNRVEKEMIALKKAGFEIDIACYTRSNRSLYEEVETGRIYRTKISKLMFKLSAAILVTPIYFMFWKKFLNEIFKQNKYDAVHIHDLPLAKLGSYLKKKNGLKLVCDQHEYYSNWVVHTSHYNTVLGKIIKLLSNWKKYERKYLNKADFVVTVEEPLRKIYIDEVGIPEEKIIVVPNTPQESIFNINRINLNIQEKYKNNFVLFYAGGIDRLRGIEMVLEAMHKLKKEIKNLKLVIAGRESKGFDLHQLSEQYDVSENVDFLGFIPHNEIPEYLKIADIGFFTPPGNRDEIHKTIATKIYQYVAMEIPIIVSNVKMMSEFVEKHDVGFTVKDSDGFYDACIKIHTDSKLKERFKSNCQNIKGRFYWKNTIKPLLNFYNN